MPNPNTPHSKSPFHGLSLYTQIGERKYLTSAERQRYFEALRVIEDPAERSFCEMIYWTGCRPGEALAMRAVNVDLEQSVVVIQSLKKRGDQKGRHFRPVPVPRDFTRRLNRIHAIDEAQRRSDHGSAQASGHGSEAKLWPFGRTKGWRLVRTVMDAADLTGIKGSARGLRHALGVHAALMQVPQTRLQSWLGHASLETTSIYVEACGPEDRAMAERMWGQR